MSQQATQSDKRQFSRFAFDSSVILEKEEQRWESSLLDISLKGVLVARPSDWKEDEGDFKITILLDNSDVTIKMNVHLAHSSKDNLGFRCEQIDLDSITCLRRLVELNLGDEEILEREISHMLTA